MRLLLFLFLGLLAVNFVFCEEGDPTESSQTSENPQQGGGTGDETLPTEQPEESSSSTTEETTVKTTTEEATPPPPPPPPPPTNPPAKGDDEKLNIEGKTFEKYTSGSQNWQVGIHYIKETSFRIRLGTPDLCSHVIVCNGYTNTTDNGTLEFSETELCQQQITFNLKEKFVKLGKDDKRPFGLSVADFINHENKLKLVLTKKIVTSNKVEGGEKEVTEEVDLGWKPSENVFYTLLGSGPDCPGIVHTFKRGTYDRYFLKSLSEGLTLNGKEVFTMGANSLRKEAKKAILPLHGGLVKDFKVDHTTEYADQCRISYLGETGVTKMGDFITIPADEPTTFKYNLAVSSAGLLKDAPKRLQLEIKDPEKCEWIRLCFSTDDSKEKNTCTEKDKVLDLVFRHRFYVPLDDDHGRLFDMPVNELDTITFTFGKNIVFMETKPVSHGDPLRHKMNLDWEMNDKAVIFAAASKCTFRLTRVDPEKTRDVSYKDEDEYTRFNGFITNCGQVIGTLTSVY